MIELIRRSLWPLACLVVALAWAVAATYDDPRQRAAAAAAAALVAATIRPRSVESTLAAVALLGAFPFAMTEDWLLAGAVVVVAAVDAVLSRRVDRALNVAGALLVAYAAIAEPHGAVALGGALLLLAGPRPLLMVPAVLVASAAVPGLPDAEAALACALAAAGLAAFDRPGPAAAALGLPGAPLLLAGVLVRNRVGMVALLPGAVALAASLSTEPLTTTTAAFAAGLVAVSALTAWRRGPDGELDLPSAVLLAWLFVAPGTWHWATTQDLSSYERGVAIALASAGVGVVATSLRRPRHGLPSTTP